MQEIHLVWPNFLEDVHVLLEVNSINNLLHLYKRDVLCIEISVAQFTQNTALHTMLIKFTLLLINICAVH